MLNKFVINPNRKIGRDIYNTPHYATEIILKYIPKNVKIIWEPANGNSYISDVLEKHGYKVIKTDIFDNPKHDFFNYEPDEEYDMILTNPPYNIKNKWLKRCYDLCKPFILLLPITSLEGVFRNKLYREYGISVVVLNRRIAFLEGKSCWFNSSWFMYNCGDKNKLYFEKI